VALLKYNLLVLVVYLLIIYSFSIAVPTILTAKPIVFTIIFITKPTVPFTKPAAEPIYITVFKAVSKGQTILLALLCYKK